jgi:hypothetical protein
MVRVRGQGGSGAAPIWFFKTNPQILQNPAKPAQDSAKFFKEKSWDFLGFLVGSGEKIIHGFGVARCVIKPNDLALSAIAPGQVAQFWRKGRNYNPGASISAYFHLAQTRLRAGEDRRRAGEVAQSARLP